MEESLEVEDLKFEWGQRRGFVGEKNDVQFYESFTYNGEEYRLYDCVLVRKDGEPEPFIGKITRMWEHPQKENPRRVELLWFFRPYELSSYLEGVSDVLSNELFLASGEGIGLSNVNSLEVICGKCSVLCISKDKRNPQPSDEEIKNAHFVFRRTFDVGRLKVMDRIDDRISGIEIKFLLNRTSANKASTGEKVEADVTMGPNSMKPGGRSSSDLVRGLKSGVAHRHKENGVGGKKGEGNEGHQQLARQKSTLTEEDSSKHSGGRDVECHSKPYSCEASASGRNHWDVKKAEERKVNKQWTKQKSIIKEKEFTKDSRGQDGGAHDEHVSYEASVSPRSHWDGKKVQESKVKNQWTEQKSRVREERHSKDSDRLDLRPLKKQKLEGFVKISDGRNVKMPQKISSSSGKHVNPVISPRYKVTKGEVLSQKPRFVEKKQDLQGSSGFEGKDKKPAAPVIRPRDKSVIGTGLSRKPKFDDKLPKHTKGEMLTEADYRRNYQMIEVTCRPDAEKRKWFRNLACEERMRAAEEKETLVLLQNVDPTFTSYEVEDVVYSALKEQCTARMIARTSLTIPHIGEALLIFKRREVAERVVQRLNDGCLLLSNGRPLVATFAKLAPAGKPPQCFGHFKLKTLMRREMRDAVATSHCSQANSIEYDMAMEWCLHQSRCDYVWEKLFKHQREEINKVRVNFKPKTLVASESFRPSNLKVQDGT